MSTIWTTGYPKRVDLINLHLKNSQNNFSLLLQRHSLLTPATIDFYPGTPLKKATFPNICFIRNMVDVRNHDFCECSATTRLSCSIYLLIDLFLHSFIHLRYLILVWRGQNSSRAVIKTHEDIITNTILQAVSLGQGLSKYKSAIQRGQTANSCCSKYLYVVTVHPSGEMAIVLGTFTYSWWKVCHIAYCYSKRLNVNRSDLFHWLPWTRMPKMCAKLVSDPFNPSRN